LSLADICADKGYVCHDLEIPNEDEFISTEKFLDIDETEFLLNYLDYRILLNELAEIFISQGWGVELKEFVAEETIEEVIEEKVIEEKGIEESPENKAVESSSENKGFFKKIKKRITKS
jgi:hypothetical protein